MKKIVMLSIVGLSISFIVMYLCGVFDSKPVYPQYVYNSCSNKWAIMTGIGRADHGDFPYNIGQFISKDNDTLYLGPKLVQKVVRRFEIPTIGIVSWSWSGIAMDSTYEDTINNCPLGREFQFNNPGEARNIYDLFQVKQEKLNKEALKQKHIDDSVRAITLAERAKQDSIWKCDHTYTIKFK